MLLWPEGNRNVARKRLNLLTNSYSIFIKNNLIERFDLGILSLKHEKTIKDLWDSTILEPNNSPGQLQCWWTWFDWSTRHVLSEINVRIFLVHSIKNQWISVIATKRRNHQRINRNEHSNKKREQRRKQSRQNRRKLFTLHQISNKQTHANFSFVLIFTDRPLTFAARKRNDKANKYNFSCINSFRFFYLIISWRETKMLSHLTLWMCI